MGTLVLTGGGVPVGIPGMGAIVGSAATTGATHAVSSAAARARRERSSDGLAGMCGILLTVVHHTRNAGFDPCDGASAVM